MDKATVIIPCFNVEDYIEECLESVALQGEVVHHTYVVDNNSTDSTVDRITQWKNANSTFPVTLLSEPKHGAPAARNKPIPLVETDWIQFLDADDLLIKGKIADQISTFKHADVICAGAYHHSIDGIDRTTTLHESNWLVALMKSQAGITSSNLFRTSSIRSAGGWDESLKSSQEYELMFRIWKNGFCFSLDREQRAIIRERPKGQISQRNSREKWIQFVNLREDMFNQSRSQHLIDSQSKRDCLQALFNSIRILARHDRKLAQVFYEKNFLTEKFSPLEDEVNSRFYVALYRTLGFKNTEIIRQCFAKRLLRFRTH